MAHGTGGPGISKLPNMLDLVIQWREKGVVPDMLKAQRIINGKTELDIPLYPYPSKAAWESGGGFKPVEGKRAGVDRVAERFRPVGKE